MGFQQGLSGLDGASKALEAIGNNVANAGTVGYKMESAQFADIFASSLGAGSGGGIGIGVQVGKVQQQFSQGNITSSSNPLDLAINGGGLFRMSNNGTITYTRNGQIVLDKSGYLVNSAGLQLTGFGADPVTGAIIPGNYVPLRLNNSAIPPQVTTLSQVQTNLDSRSLPPATMTHGSETGIVPPPTIPVTITAANDNLQGNVDGVSFNVTIPLGVYTSAANLAAAAQTAINSGLTSGASVTVNVVTGGLIQVQSVAVGSQGSGGTGSTVTLTAANGTGVFGFAIPTATAVNVGVSGGAITGGANPASTTIALGVNDLISGSVDGVTFTNAKIAPSAYGSAAALAGAVLTAINTGAAPAGLSGTGKSLLSATINGSGNLVLTSASTATGSAVTLTGGTGAANLGFPTVTTGVDNFSATNTASYTSSTAQTVFDSLGNAHTLQIFYAKTSNSTTGRWQVYTSLDGGATGTATALDFDSNGLLKTSMIPPIQLSFNLNNGATTPLKFGLDLTNSTQYGISFGTNQLLQDGFTSGKLSGINVSSDGIVQGRYSNGKSRNMGQVVLATFNNMNGLESLGGNQWTETSESGQPIPGIPGTGNLGLVQSGSVEESNVDMTAELVDMITQQRAYQANAQSIKTEDQIMQTLVNLK